MNIETLQQRRLRSSTIAHGRVTHVVFKFVRGPRIPGLVVNRRELASRRWCAEEAQLVAELDEVFLLAQGAGDLTARNFRRAGKGVGLGTRPRKLLEMSKVLHNEPLFLSCDGTATSLLHEIENSFTVLTLTTVLLVLMSRKIDVEQEVGVAQLANQRTAKDRRR